MGTLCFFLFEEATEMAIVKTNDQYYNDIAAAIRSKNGESALYYPSEMAQKIRNIPSGGGATNLDKIQVNGGVIVDGQYLVSRAPTVRNINDGLWTVAKKSSDLDDTMDHRNAYNTYINMISSNTTQVKVGCRFYDWTSITTNGTYYVACSADGQFVLPNIYVNQKTKILTCQIATSTGSFTLIFDTVLSSETWYEVTAEWDGTTLTCLLYDSNGILLESKSVNTTGSINSRYDAYYIMGTYHSSSGNLPKLTLDTYNCFVEVDNVMIRGMNEMRK